LIIVLLLFRKKASRYVRSSRRTDAMLSATCVRTCAESVLSEDFSRVHILYVICSQLRRLAVKRVLRSYNNYRRVSMFILAGVVDSACPRTHVILINVKYFTLITRDRHRRFHLVFRQIPRCLNWTTITRGTQNVLSTCGWLFGVKKN